MANSYRSGPSRQSHYRSQFRIEQQVLIISLKKLNSNKKKSKFIDRFLCCRNNSTVICGEDTAIGSKEARQMFPTSKCRNQSWMPIGASFVLPTEEPGPAGVNNVLRKSSKRNRRLHLGWMNTGNGTHFFKNKTTKWTPSSGIYSCRKNWMETDIKFYINIFFYTWWWNEMIICTPFLIFVIDDLTVSWAFGQTTTWHNNNNNTLDFFSDAWILYLQTIKIIWCIHIKISTKWSS